MKRYKVILNEENPEENSIIIEADSINVVAQKDTPLQVQFFNYTEKGIVVRAEFFSVVGYIRLPDLDEADTP